jgi:type III secretion system FlhB-like substrate exporter
MRFGNGEERFKAPNASGDGDAMAHSIVAGARKNAVDIVGKDVEIEVAVAIDKHQAAPSSFST